MQGKSVSPLALSGKPQFMMWYQQFHSGTRAVSMALMKSHTPMAVETQISCAPIPFIGGVARVGSLFLTRWELAGSSFVSIFPSPFASMVLNDSGNTPAAASSWSIDPFLFLSSHVTTPLAAMFALAGG